MSKKTHIHEFRIPRPGYPTIVYRHRIKARVCKNHPEGLPFFCWCEPECYERPGCGNKMEVVFDVVHQNKIKEYGDPVIKDCPRG